MKSGPFIADHSSSHFPFHWAKRSAIHPIIEIWKFSCTKKKKVLRNLLASEYKAVSAADRSRGGIAPSPKQRRTPLDAEWTLHFSFHLQPDVPCALRNQIRLARRTTFHLHVSKNNRESSPSVTRLPRATGWEAVFS